MRFRELSVKQKVASGDQLKALLLEFNIKVSSKRGGLRGVIESTLEDAENGLTFEFRDALSTAWKQYSAIITSINIYDECLNKPIEIHPDFKSYLKLKV